MQVFIGCALTNFSKNKVENWQKEIKLSSNSRMILERNFDTTLFYSGELTDEELARYITELKAVQCQKITNLTVKIIKKIVKKRRAIIVLSLENTD
ncbi:MAG: hypothetical protein ACRCZG_03585 [Culicoidibacterales bacterium]